jgi:hypothetical protein
VIHAQATIAASANQTQVIAALIAGLVALVASLVAATLTTMSATSRLRREFQLEYAAERAAKELLTHEDWGLRSFTVIARHLSGFGDDELRKLLVRAGAIRFNSKSGKELWGLLERNRERLGGKITYVTEVPEVAETEDGPELASPSDGPG